MKFRLRFLYLALALTVPSLCLWASQNIVFRNLIYLLGYERTLDTYSQSDTTLTEVTVRIDPSGREAGVLSAFFGLDNGLPNLFGLAACRGAGGMDGMPVIFSHEIDIKTLEPGDFQITTASGSYGKVVCLTMAPADDPGELRTALLIGEYGSVSDQPTKVEIVGNVLSKDHKLNFRGASISVTPLESGPRLVFAQRVPPSEWDLGRKATRLPWGGGNACPIGTAQVVRVTWDGGVKKLDGNEADMTIGMQYDVTVLGPDAKPRMVKPVALADLGDGDNNHLLCLDVTDPATMVRFPAGLLKDPRNDLNDETTVQITKVL